MQNYVKLIDYILQSIYQNKQTYSTGLKDILLLDFYLWVNCWSCQDQSPWCSHIQLLGLQRQQISRIGIGT